MVSRCDSYGIAMVMTGLPDFRTSGLPKAELLINSLMTTSFKELKVWQEAHEFVLKVYTVTRVFPDWERYALTSQFLRAAVSVPANIAEGYRKMGKADKLKFMNIAQGSLEECRYYIILAKDLGYINVQTHDVLEQKAEFISRLLTAYCKPIIAERYKNDVK